MKKNVLKKALAVLVILAMMVPFMPVITVAEGAATVQYVDWDQWDADGDGLINEDENDSKAPNGVNEAYTWIQTNCKKDTTNVVSLIG